MLFSTLAQEAQAPGRAEETLVIPRYFPDAQSRFDPDADAAFQTSKREKVRLLEHYPQASARLSYVLLQVMDMHERLGKDAAVPLARAADAEVVEELITVIIQLAAVSDQDAISKQIVAAGGVVVRARPDHIKARVPTSALSVIAETIPGVHSVRIPEKPCLDNTTISQGVGVMNAQTWQTAGFKGSGVKVAIIDLGFIGLASRKAADEIPTSAISVDETGLGMETGTDHGCGVAETVYDMAPNAQLYLIKIADVSDLQNAKDYCKANGIQIVNHSVGWAGFNFFDGQTYASVAPSPISVVNDANAN
ncbi:MAG: hypothetical protein NT154_21310, partial [Verrucomicrobia bacterium]|nr:hypothetical protein [Verrucomicrobiota bacterium]